MTNRSQAMVWADRGVFVLRTILLMTGVFVVGFVSAGTALGRHDARGVTGFADFLGTLSVLLSVLAVVGLMVMLLVRRRKQNEVAWGYGILAVIFPLGPVMAFMLPQTIKDEKRPSWRGDAFRLSALYVVGLLVFFIRDLSGRTPNTSIVRAMSTGSDWTSSTPVGLNPFGVVVLFVVMAAAPIAIGYYRRAKDELKTTKVEVVTQRAAADTMSAQLSRQSERELIAREVHDVIGHRLSLLSLHAGGLEVSAAQDPELRESAKFVRENAQQAMDDLRSLIGVLREPGAGPEGSLDPSVTSLADLTRVVDEMAETGGPVASSVFLSDPEDADPVLAHSVYRIVQELLTNARKHAPGQVVRLRVSGGPEDGVSIQSTNPLEKGAIVSASGTGLRGIRERAELLGGTVDVPQEDGQFTVRVQLPWQAKGRA
ncbi:sensor histidine kinase [Ornithinimicrobium sp. Y1694]|uniref:sensor histidine kinase n=1 Tax=Ornithinimicrobium sp. Y1694 TaxID=3418590 RepID=UPI003CE90C57